MGWECRLVELCLSAWWVEVGRIESGQLMLELALALLLLFSRVNVTTGSAKVGCIQPGIQDLVGVADRTGGTHKCVLPGLVNACCMVHPPSGGEHRDVGRHDFVNRTIFAARKNRGGWVGRNGRGQGRAGSLSNEGETMVPLHR